MVVIGKVEMLLSRVLCLSIAYTISTIFANIHTNMGQNPSILTIEQQSFLFILTIPEELFTTIASFMDTESQVAFAHTCETVYAYHKKQCKKKAFIVMGDHQQYKSLYISYYIKVLQRRMSQSGWGGVKVTLKIASVDPQNNYDNSIRTLWLDCLLYTSRCV